MHEGPCIVIRVQDGVMDNGVFVVLYERIFREVCRSGRTVGVVLY
jgi:hypothetical protein